MTKQSKKAKQSKRRQKERRLLLSLLLLIASGIFLGTATYAWFTANEKVTVSPIDVTVSTSSGIQISTDAKNWKSVISNTDITGASSNYSGAVNQLPSQLEPVSSAGNVDSTGKMEMYLGKIETNAGGDFILTATKSTETNTSGEDLNAKFVAFDIFLKNEQAETLYMTPLSTVAYVTSDSGIKNATRVAFVNLGHSNAMDNDSNRTTIQGLNGNSGADAVVKFWEPNYDVHVLSGINNAANPYGITAVGGVNLQVGANNPWIPYSGVKANIASSANIKREQATQALNASYFTSFAYDSTANPAQTIAYDSTASTGGNQPVPQTGVTPTTHTANYIATKEGYTNSEYLASLDAGITKFRVYMWIEGQDVDCENMASGGEVVFNLQLSIQPVTLSQQGGGA